MKIWSLLGSLGLMVGVVCGDRVFIASGSEGIYTAELDPGSGVLGSIRKVSGERGSTFLALHPEKPILYSTERVAGEKPGSYVVAFRVGEGGEVEKINESGTGGAGVCHVSLDQSGSFAFAANYAAGSVASFKVKGDGGLSEAICMPRHEGSSVNEKRQKGPHAHWIGVGPGNQFVYVPDLGIDRVVIYGLDDQTGELKRVGEGSLQLGSGPRHMKFSKGGEFAYVLNELNLTITVFAVDKDSGALKEEQTLSTVPDDFDKEGVTCSEIRVHPNGKFVYCGLRDLETRNGGEVGRNSLSVFSVGEDGNLERVQTVSAEVCIPRNFNLSPSGKWLLAGGQGSNDVQVFAVGEDGRLEARGEVVEVPNPMCFEFLDH